MEGTDNVKRQDFVDNFEIIDKELKANNTSVNNVINKVENIKIADGTTSQKGIVQLEDSISSTSTIKAATPNSVKVAYDKGNEALNKANQAFQYASNGKNLIAGKVGNVSGNNTHAEIANRIQIDKNTAASNLNSKGVSANGNETLASLVSKISKITTNGFSSGETYTSKTGQGEKHEIFINVGFKPSAVVIYNYNTVKKINSLYVPSLELFLKNDFSMDVVRVTEDGFYAYETFNRPGGDVVRYICFK
ncbi:phage tail protein [Clostridium sp. YB-6]|uniref:Phage tail protein n=2 Tax=Clostridium weizhouense TaxID=2859781 RepID=A0ABS7AJW6_9CLOT|nr:phage tail protein [Clostridium weizhouense]